MNDIHRDPRGSDNLKVIDKIDRTICRNFTFSDFSTNSRCCSQRFYFFCASCMLGNAVTVNKQLAVFFEDRYNNYLVLKHGNACYYWKTSGADAQSLQIQSAQRTLEERLIKAVEAGTQLTPFTPVKTEVSFVIVASCRASTNYHIAVPPAAGR